VSIVPRGMALGVTYQRPDADRYNYPEGYLRARIIGMLGGRAAEELVYGTKPPARERHRAGDPACPQWSRAGVSEALGMVQPRPEPVPGSRAGIPERAPVSEETAPSTPGPGVSSAKVTWRHAPDDASLGTAALASACSSGRRSTTRTSAVTDSRPRRNSIPTRQRRSGGRRQ
jgi:hypothetical protein